MEEIKVETSLEIRKKKRKMTISRGENMINWLFKRRKSNNTFIKILKSNKS